MLLMKYLYSTKTVLNDETKSGDFYEWVTNNLCEQIGRTIASKWNFSNLLAASRNSSPVSRVPPNILLMFYSNVWNDILSIF